MTQRIIINLYGGLIQDVIGDNDVEVVVVDWDQEGVTEEDMKKDDRCTVHTQPIDY